MYIIHGEKSASWQLVAVVVGLKTMQSGKKRRQIAKINPKSKKKFALSARIFFWFPSFLKFFPGMIYIYIHISIWILIYIDQ